MARAVTRGGSADRSCTPFEADQDPSAPTASSAMRRARSDSKDDVVRSRRGLINAPHVSTTPTVGSRAPDRIRSRSRAVFRSLEPVAEDWARCEEDHCPAPSVRPVQYAGQPRVARLGPKSRQTHALAARQPRTAMCTGNSDSITSGPKNTGSSSVQPAVIHMSGLTSPRKMTPCGEACASIGRGASCPRHGLVLVPAVSRPCPRLVRSCSRRLCSPRSRIGGGFGLVGRFLLVVGLFVRLRIGRLFRRSDTPPRSRSIQRFGDRVRPASRSCFTDTAYLSRSSSTSARQRLWAAESLSYKLVAASPYAIKVFRRAPTRATALILSRPSRRLRARRALQRRSHPPGSARRGVDGRQCVSTDATRDRTSSCRLASSTSHDARTREQVSARRRGPLRRDCGRADATRARPLCAAARLSRRRRAVLDKRTSKLARKLRPAARNSSSEIVTAVPSRERARRSAPPNRRCRRRSSRTPAPSADRARRRRSAAQSAR